VVACSDEMTLTRLTELLTYTLASEGADDGIALQAVIALTVFQWLTAQGFEPELVDSETGAQAIVDLVGEVRFALAGATRAMIAAGKLRRPRSLPAGSKQK
jgi:hypothetical protein